MKKLPVILLVFLILSFTLAACSGEPETPDDPNPPNGVENTPPPVTSDNNDPQNPPQSGSNDPGNENGTPEVPPPEPTAFFFKIGDTVVNLNEDINNVIAGAGEPVGVLELPSCAFDGMDRVFRYPGADLYTYPVGDNDFVYNIAFFDDTIRTAEGGIRLGSSLQAVLDAYGEDYEFDAGMYKFTRGKTALSFLTDNDSVIGITYRYAVEDTDW